MREEFLSTADSKYVTHAYNSTFSFKRTQRCWPNADSRSGVDDANRRRVFPDGCCWGWEDAAVWQWWTMSVTVADDWWRYSPASHSSTLFLIVISTRNRVSEPGSKIYYPVPNPGNWYPFLHWFTDKTNENFATCSLCHFVAKLSRYCSTRKVQLQPFLLKDHACLLSTTQTF